MKNKNKIIALNLFLCIILGVFAQLILPVSAYADNSKVIYISSAEEFVDFAKKCSYDAWSADKTVLLTADISLKNVSFGTIPTFSGVFDGQGYTISDIDISGAYSPAGLFSYIEKGAKVKNLTVKGTITPSGDKGYVGGIVGINSGVVEDCIFVGTVIGASDIGGIAGKNTIGGTISNCKVEGEIIGESRSGGIAGSNEGLISSCHNSAKVNTIAITPSLSLDEINISLTLDITKLPSLNNTTMTDIGGIAGYSIGIVMSSVNDGAVGYPHVGYNVGGIVGRNSGHLANNTNLANINGRKDVGGIVGQMEPYVSYNLSEDLLASLKAELEKLEAAINGVTGTSGGGINGISSRLDTIIDNIQGATDGLDQLIKDGTDYGNDVIGEVNRFSEVIGEVISQLSGIVDDLPELGNTLQGSFAELESALENIKEFSSVTEGMISDLTASFDDAASAFENINGSLNSISSALLLFENALTIHDKDAAAEALNDIADGLGGFIVAIDNFTASIKLVTDVLDDMPWVNDATSEITKLTEVFGNISDSISTIYDASKEISENIDIYWNKFEEAGDELIVAVGHIQDMTECMAEAFVLIDSGVSKLSEGLNLLYEAIKIKDADKIEQAINDIEGGLTIIIDSVGNLQTIMDEFEAILNEFENSSLNEIFGLIAPLSSILSDLIKSGNEAADGIIKILEGAVTLLGNIDVDFDNIEEGGKLVISGIGDLSDSIEPIKNAVISLKDGMTAIEKAVIAIDEAIDIKDEEKLKAAFESAYKAVGDMVNALSDMSDIFKDMAKTLEAAGIWGEKLIDAVGSVATTLTEMSNALITVKDGIDSLRANISFDADNVTEGMGLIRDGLDKLSAASLDIKNCFSHLSDALTDLNGGSEYLNAVITDMKEAIGGIKDAMGSISIISEKVGRLIGYLKGVDTVQIPSPPESMTATANQIFIHISAIETELKYLNADITGLGNEMLGYIESINEIFGNISDNIVSMIYSLNDGSFIDNNVREEEIDSITQGKLFMCINYGNVSGDINIGGISGAMGLEYTLDPEDDYTIELSITQKKQYQMKAVIHACINSGDVTSKYDCAGGIVGKMDLGLIYGCESYCDVESQSGNYVGGIAGITAGLISQCFAKCALYGGKYIGGIVGTGTTESYSGASSMVRNCYSMVDIKRFTQYAGAISGIKAGEYNENLFVSDLLCGIDNVSYAGKAEPITYQDLMKRRSIPDEFRMFKLEFIANGEVLNTIRFEYGSSFDNSVFPEIPEMEGHYGYWDKTDLSHLVFDTKVSVVYKPYTTTIGSEEKRENGHEVFFVLGEFVEGDVIKINSGCDTSNLILTDKFFTVDQLVESWVLIIPGDNIETNRVHFLPTNSHARIYVKCNGVWQEVESSQFGSYITFNVSGEQVEIAVVEHSVKLVPVIIAASIALVVIASVIIVCVIVRKKAKAKKTDEESNNKNKA